jgi:hypothetical protein
VNDEGTRTSGRHRAGLKPWAIAPRGPIASGTASPMQRGRRPSISSALVVVDSAIDRRWRDAKPALLAARRQVRLLDQADDLEPLDGGYLMNDRPQTRSYYSSAGAARMPIRRRPPLAHGLRRVTRRDVAHYLPGRRLRGWGRILHSPTMPVCLKGADAEHPRVTGKRCPRRGTCLLRPDVDFASGASEGRPPSVTADRRAAA